MLKKKITYINFDGQQVTEEHCFHLSKAELIEMELGTKGGLQAHLDKIANSNDGAVIVAEFKKLLLDSYGKKSDDGNRFIKSQAIREEFAASEAYSEFFMELATNAESAAEFVNGILPANLEVDLAKIEKNQQSRNAFENNEPQLATGARQIPRDEAVAMDQTELQKALTEGAIIV